MGIAIMVLGSTHHTHSPSRHTPADVTPGGWMLEEAWLPKSSRLSSEPSFELAPRSARRPWGATDAQGRGCG